jgi:hypothetical protein
LTTTTFASVLTARARFASSSSITTSLGPSLRVSAAAELRQSVFRCHFFRLAYCWSGSHATVLLLLDQRANIVAPTLRLHQRSTVEHCACTSRGPQLECIQRSRCSFATNTLIARL